LSTDFCKDILEFHDEVILNRFTEGKDYPHIPSQGIIDLRRKLVKEETDELFLGIDSNNLEEIADGAADSIVVIIGLCITYGIDLQKIWDEVHRTNMLKKDGPIRADGKRLKPSGWKPPEIKKLLNDQGAKL
jgi:predicted HAD superfamily Cof-like phosphohydrolase